MARPAFSEMTHKVEAERFYIPWLYDLRCGELDGGVDGEHVWMACDCGGASDPAA